MNDLQASEPRRAVQRQSKEGRDLRSKLLRSHMSLAGIGVGLLLVAFVSTLQMRASTLRLARERGPMVHASTLALAGVQRSLAGLRGWMALGNPEFAEDRARAWEEDIGPAIDELQQISRRTQNSQDTVDLDQLSRVQYNWSSHLMNR